MPLFSIVTKILLLTSSIAYEYGYHPSAEEFDNLMRETRRTWTGDLIANERQRKWQMPISQRRSDNSDTISADNRIGELFIPKYKYERARNPYESILSLKWPGYTEKIIRKPTEIEIDQEIAASSISAASSIPSEIVSQNLASSLDFTMFSHEANTGSNADEIATVSSKPVGMSGESLFASPIPPKLTNLTIIEEMNNDDSSDRGQISMPAWHNKYSINNLYSNNSEAHFPIFFTNPVTNIVYAITEIGKIDGNFTTNSKEKNDNNTIPIYITKEQYDRDIFLLKKSYENKCSSAINVNKTLAKPTAASALSVPVKTTHRPQIIRLQKPTQSHISVSKLPVAKLPTKLNNNKPPQPVKVQTAVTVNDQVQLSPPKRLQKLKNKKKKKRPGRKQVGMATQSSTMPQIIKGVRPTTLSPTRNKDNIHSYTQLERPNFPATTTIFSNRPIAATSGYVLSKQQKLNPQTNVYTNHRLSKRSLPIENSTNAAPIVNNPSTERALKVKLKTKIAPIRRMRVRRKKFPNSTTNLTNIASNHFIKRNQSTTIRFIRKQKPSTTPSPVAMDKTTISRGVKNTNNKNHTILKSNKDHRNAKPTKREKDDDTGFNIFDLLDNDSGDDDDDDDDDDDENDDEYYDYKDHTNRPTKKPKRHILKESNSSNNDDDNEENDDDETVTTDGNNNNKYSLEELKEQNSHDKSSSAEDSADFGALEEFDIPVEEQQEATPESQIFSSDTKNIHGKKRIRRRPPPAIASSEDYNDDDDDENDGGGVGGFFRMLFYPVEMAMTSIFDRLGGGPGDFSDEEDDNRPGYPTYTQYHSNSQTAAKAEEMDEAQGNSFSSWFSSLFGFNRRTKKIGSTTTVQTPLPTEPTEPPGWFESWFGFGGDKTETTSAETSTSNEDYDDYDKWFSSWFNTKPKARRRTTSTTTTTATLPQVPILTIVDPMKNPQNWLGILAHHIVNSTATTTHNPIVEALTRATTTENPDIPRFISYDKYQIWRLKPQDESHVKAMEEYKRSDEGSKLQWLKGPSLRGVNDVLVPPKMIIDFEGSLQFESIAHEILIFDVGKAIAYEQGKEQYYMTTPRPQKNPQKYTSLISMSWNKYYGYDDIITYLETIRMRHPQIVELFHIGRTYEGRPLIVVKLELKRSTSTINNDKLQVNRKKLKHKKKSGLASAVFIDGGTHGLEWIGPATATWMINELLRIMKNNKTSEDTDYIKNTTWYIMPVLNPDGYVYSHEYDRFWRKSRSRHISRPTGLLNSAMTWLQQKTSTEKVCYGVDLDRNWHYHWGKRGSSKSPCNEQFAGPVAFSEPETKALSDFLMDNRKQIKLYISMQAYGQIVSYPSKSNNTFDTERSEDFMDVAMVGTDGLRKKGSKSRYKVDSSNDLIENRSGCPDAFAAYEVGIPFSYTLYLADNGVHGYLLPSSAIETTSRDAFEIVTSMLDYI